MLTTWLNTSPGIDYERTGLSNRHVLSQGKFGGRSIMKFSTRLEADMTAAELFDRVSDFDRFEHNLAQRGANITRIDPSKEPGIGIGWDVRIDWRGKERQMRLEVQRFDRPELVTIFGHSDALEISNVMTVLALSKTRSRLEVETVVSPRNMRARLLLQTAKLGKNRLDQRYAERIRAFVLANPAA